MAGLTGAGGGAQAAGRAAQPKPKPIAPPSRHARGAPNFVFIICDQLGLDAIKAHGCADPVRTPNMDRLIRRGTTFIESHSTSPVCSPARSSLMTGRMPTETGVVTNTRSIHPDAPNIGEWLREAGYDTAHCGKWHLPHGYPTELAGFDVLPVGHGQGDLCDHLVSRSCEAYIKSRKPDDPPFLLVTSFMQPHDICYWAIRGEKLVPKELPFPEIASQLPELPPNHRSRPPAPKRLDSAVYENFTDAQWRYYIYIYYRQVEMVDADIGRVMNALEESGQADNTVIVLTSDHGEGRGRHMHVQKWYPYEEAAKVPLVWSCPGRVPEGKRDTTHLVSGIDVAPTLCDYAGIAPAPQTTGQSLRPLLEGRETKWRDFLVFDTHIIGRVVRSERYKYVKYEGDPVEQLFDMREDPWEMRNLYADASSADVVKDHRRMLEEWTARLRPVEAMKQGQYIRPRKRW